MKRICYMLLAAAFLAAGCTKEDNGGPDVNVTKTEVCKSVTCGTITDASDHFPIYVDVTIGNSSLPLLEEKVSLGSYNVVAEDYQ